MKKVIMISAFALMASFSAFSQKKAILVFKTENIEMGKIVQYKPDSKIFEFSNKGKEPLQLMAVHPSCGCTAAEYSKFPILPGQSGFIKIEYNSMMIGLFRKTITVQSNSEPGNIILTISGEVIPETKGK